MKLPHRRQFLHLAAERPQDLAKEADLFFDERVAVLLNGTSPRLDVKSMPGGTSGLTGTHSAAGIVWIPQVGNWGGDTVPLAMLAVFLQAEIA